MDALLGSDADEVTRLRACLNDLVGVLALPALWSGGDPPRIVTTSLDALVGMLDLAFATGLQQTRLLSEQQRVAKELDARIAQRTGELAAATEALRETERNSRLLVDSIKRAEAGLRQAYSHLAEAQRLSKTGSFISDLVADHHDWSEQAFRIFEFAPTTGITLQAIRELVHPDDLSLYDAAYNRALAGVGFDMAFRIVTSAGYVKHLHAVGHVMEEIAGRSVFIGAIQDVTESRVAEEALNKARSELAHVARVTTLSTLTASIAHEVNQPLSGIITNAGTCLRMLDANPPNIDGARETARRTIRDGNRASEVVTRMRALFSRKEFTPEPLDLNEATREVVTLSLSELQRNRVIVQSELADDLPPITGDRVQLQQVILNLLRNASDAMVGVDDRPRQLLIRTLREDGDHVRVSVTDDGVGLNSESTDKLFDAFYTTKTNGMGIGLSVSRSIVERHQGRLWAEPNDGPGATFSFSIPRSRDSIGPPGIRA